MSPFVRGEIVVSKLRHLTVDSGDRVRIVQCVKGECGSGWLVDATSTLRGRIGDHPVLSMRNIDSDWFNKIKAAKKGGER